MQYGSMLIAITGLITYQIAMKSAPRNVNPWWLLSLAYGTSSILCLIAGLLWRHLISPADLTPQGRHLVAVGCISLTVILIEIGYLLVYRSGWSLSIAPAFAQAVALSSLFVLGLLLFGERFSLTKAAGLLLCVLGIFLLTRATSSTASPSSRHAAPHHDTP